MNGQRRSTAVVTLIVVVAALSAGRSLFVPIFLAAFLAFLLAPVASWLERRLHMPTVLSVIVAVAVAAGAVAGIGVALTGEVAEVVEKLPSYRENFDRKLQALAGVKRQLEDVSEDIEEIKGEVTGEKGEVEAEEEAPDKKAVPVTVVERKASRFERLTQTYLTPIANFLGSLAIVLLFVPFFLLARKSLRDRLVHLLRDENVYLTARAVDEATDRVSTYLLTTVVVNLAYGIPVGLGLHLIGLPNALLWGLLATLLRFIPYVGPWTAALLTLGAAAAIFPGWQLFWAVVALIVVLETLTSSVLEPWLYGKRTGLSTLAVLMAAFFWSWLWGIAGLFLAVPISLCLVVIGRYVPSLAFLHVLMTNSDAAARHTYLFQRIVVGDTEGARRIARRHVEREGWISLIDRHLVPALRLAEQELRDGLLDERRAHFVAVHVAHIAEDLASDASPVAHNAGKVRIDTPEDGSPFDRSHARVLRAACRALGIDADAAGAPAVLVAEKAQESPPEGAAAICIRRGPKAQEGGVGAAAHYSFADFLFRIRERGTAQAVARPVVASTS